MKRTSFCAGWEFARDDGEFESVVVPHDAMLDNPRGPDAPAGSASGYYFGARYRYRKTFELSSQQVLGTLYLEFEGVYHNARIWVNGIELYAPPYGFVPFFVGIGHAVHPGNNVIEVEAGNAEQPDCRWYSGGGIYRPVWLWEGAREHIQPEGVRITTTSIDPPRVQIDVLAEGGLPIVSVLDSFGNLLAAGEGPSVELEVADAHLWSAEQPVLYRCHIDLLNEQAACTDDSRPTLIDVTHASDLAQLRSSRVVLDEAEVTFGIRTVEWSPQGLFVNGQETVLRGGCIHCDNGVIGAASFAESERRRVRLLKKAGFNAIRIAHNPAPTTLLTACDEFGMYVMDEAWDMWFMRKNPFDYARHFLDWCDYDLRRLATRDYNHPSVIMYSIGNEVADPTTNEGVEIERSMVDLLHDLDPTRPVTCGFNLTMMVMERLGRRWYAQSEADASNNLVDEDSGSPRASLLFNLAAQATGAGMTRVATLPGADKLISPGLDALDIAGYNYGSARYVVDARKHPERIIVGTETFQHEIVDNWNLVEKTPNLVGDFMWAAWDYLGEAGAGAWAYTPDEAGFSKPYPWLIAGSGALDILGQPNAAAALAGAVWNALPGPSIQVRPVNIMRSKTYKATWRGSDAIPSWSWRGMEGTLAEVEVYDGHAHSIRLELNQNVVGVSRVKKRLARFRVRYEPGTLSAVSLDEDGREIARSELVSAQGPLHIDLHPEKPVAPAGDVAYIPLSIVGTNHAVEANADEEISIKVEGGTLVGFGSARPTTLERFTSGHYSTYRGRALAVVYRDAPGVATLHAQGVTLAPVTATIWFA